MMKALIFDCDGVLVDTERDGHRVSFNRAFKAKGFGFEWSVAQYKELLKIAGGKERMSHYFNQVGWPAGINDKDALIKELHKLKTELFMKIIESGELPLRPGVKRIVDEASAEGMLLAVCSTSNEKAVSAVVNVMLGAERAKRFHIFAGDVVKKKKPDPEIYLLAQEKLNLKPSECFVVEDSRNGFLAAKSAGTNCVITTNDYTIEEDFTGADLIVSELGDEPRINVRLSDLKTIILGKSKGK